MEVDERIKRGLGKLRKSSCGKHIVFLSLNITELHLDSSQIGVLEKYLYLQEIDASHNNLTDISVLGSMKNLLTLDVSHNNIESLLNFNAPNITMTNFSFNRITAIPNMDGFPFIRKLDLSGNDIEKIEGLESLKYLRTLLLARNKITKIEGLDGLSLLRLDLSENLIETVENLECQKNLEVLFLNKNKVEDISHVKVLESLQEVDFSGNMIDGVGQVEHLVTLKLLRVLWLHENPIEEGDGYNATVLHLVPWIRTLDGNDLSAEAKVKVENMFGADEDSRKEIYTRVFSEE